MAEEVEMTPVDATEPPKVNPLAKPALPGGQTMKTASALRPGLKLPPKPGATASALKPGLKLPPKPGLATGLKLPPKPGATAVTKPLIRKPGEGAAVSSLPKPVVPVDAQGVGKLPTVEARSIDRAETMAPVEMPKPMETLKSVTQKLKGLTQSIPQQAILHKTGIIAEGAAQTDAQKEAAKHKTARISLSDAMGVAPVKDAPAPMKTIRIKRPVNIPGSTSPTLTPQPRPETAAAAAPAESAAEDSSTSVTQRKTLKITRPGGTVRPTGKFGVKKSQSQATTMTGSSSGDGAADGEVADIPDLPAASAAVPVPRPVTEAPAGAGTTLAVVVQLAASLAVGALVWFFWENSQLATYCGGLGWGQ